MITVNCVAHSKDTSFYDWPSSSGLSNSSAERVRQVTVVHEGMHGKGTYADEYLAPGGYAEIGNRYYGGAHQEPYNNGAIDLLGEDQ